MSHDYDSPWKQALHRYFRDFLLFFYPSIAEGIDWSQGYSSKDKELLRISKAAKLGNREADCLMQVTRLDGQPGMVLIHIEVQNQSDSDFTERMFIYHYRVFDRYRSPVCSLAVLGDEQAGWRPSAYRHDCWDCKLRFEFPICKLEDWRPQLARLERLENPFGPLVAAHLHSRSTKPESPERRQIKFRMLKLLLRGGLSQEDVRELFRLIDWLLHLSSSQKRLFIAQVENFQKERGMTYIDVFEEIGIKKGRKKGLEEGLEKGLEQARQQLRATIIGTLARRTEGDTTQVGACLDQITDVQKLSELAVSAGQVQTLEAFQELLDG